MAAPSGWVANAARTHETTRQWTGSKNGQITASTLLLIPAFCPELKVTDPPLHSGYPHFKPPLCNHNTRFSFCILLLKYIVLPINPTPTLHDKNLTQIPHPSLHPPGSPAQVSRIHCPRGILEYVPWVAKGHHPGPLWGEDGGEGARAPRGSYLRALATCS